MPEDVDAIAMAVDRKSKNVVRLTVVPPSGDAAHPAIIDIGYTEPGTQRPTLITLRVPEGLTATDLRRMPWSAYLWSADVTMQYASPGSATDSVFHVEDAEVALHEEGLPQTPRGRPGRRGWPDAFYRDIAARYQKLVLQGIRNPTATVAKEQFASRHTAAGWVREARRRGHLPPARPGRPG